MKWRLPRFSPWITPYPLPQDTARVLMEREGESDNFGLYLDRLLVYGEQRRTLALVREFVNRKALTPDFTQHKALIAALNRRWLRLSRELGAVTFTAHPEWRVLIGVAGHKILETNIALHPVHGFPMISATALKGLARHYAEAVDDAPPDTVRHLFGSIEEEVVQGDLIFLDAIPLGVPVIERDVVNPQWGAIYGGIQNTPAADLVSPKPVFMMAVSRASRFLFGVASLSHDAAAVEQGVDWLQRGLTELGVGAKTASGYGYWVIEEGP